MNTKKIKFLCVILTFIFLFSFSYSYAANEEIATETNENDVVSVTQDEVTEGVTVQEPQSDENTTTTEETEKTWLYEDFFKNGEDITVNEIIDGNAFIRGKNVTINGEIGGDLFIVAEKVTIENGYVYSNLFVVTNELVINGIVYDLYACANNISLSENGIVARDFRAIANNVTLNGQINRNALISADTSLSIGENCSISGNLKYKAPEELTIENVVSGEIKYEPITQGNTKSNIISSIKSVFSSILYTLIITLLLMKLAPNYFEKLSNCAKKPSTYLFGLLFFAIMPILIIALILTTIGFRISFALSLVYILCIALASPITNMTIGTIIDERMKNTTKSRLLTILAVTAILAILKLIPFVNIFVYFVVIIAGFSLFIHSLYENR